MNLPAVDAALNAFASALPTGLTCRILTQHDSATLDQLRRDIVHNQLPDPNCYRIEAENPSFPMSHLSLDGVGEKGLIIGYVENNQRLVGYGALTLPAPGELNLGAALSLPDEQCAQVAYMASAMVREEWRNRGLHHALIMLRMDLAAAFGRRHVIASTWPGNYLSWGNLAQHGLLGKKLIAVAGKLQRLVMHIDLDGPQYLPDPKSMLLVPLAEFAVQPRFFDEGYWLWQRVKTDVGIYAMLAMPQKSPS